MSLMFPTIYGLAVQGLGHDTKLGASGLIMAILGGAVLTAVQGRVSDAVGIGTSFLVPVAGFGVILLFALYCTRRTNPPAVAFTIAPSRPRNTAPSTRASRLPSNRRRKRHGADGPGCNSFLDTEHRASFTSVYKRMLTS